MRFVARVTGLGLILSYAVGWGLHSRYADHHQTTAAHHGTAHPEHTLSPLAHYLRDSTLAAPFVIGLVLVTTVVAKRILARQGIAADSGAAKLIFASAIALTAAAGVSFSTQNLGVGLATLRYTFALTIGLTLLFGMPIKTGVLVS